MKIKRVLIVMVSLMIISISAGGCADTAGNGTGNGTGKVLSPDSFDQYGGLKSITGTATGYFHVEKIGTRWWFITPEGNAFWSIGVNAISDGLGDGTDENGNSYGDNIISKYGGDKTLWANESLKKLLSWGHNTIGAASSSYTDPMGMYGRPPSIPKVVKAYKRRFGTYAIRDAGTLNLLDGLPDGGVFPDVYAPSFLNYVASVAADSVVTGGIAVEAVSPWVLGIYSDEELRGFGAKDRHIHLGWAAGAASAATYTKQAWRDFLLAKYDTLSALNAAYGTAYTIWDTNGSTGVLDEDGSNLGNPISGSTDPDILADQNEFLFNLSYKYFEITSNALRSYHPNHMILGPMFSTWDTVPRDEVLLAARDFIDVYGVGENADHKYIYDLTGKPTLVYTAWVTAEPDSPLNLACGPPENGLCSSTQEGRGQLYRDLIYKLVNNVTADGTHMVIGAHFWKWSDNGLNYWLETRNFGLVTIKDNAYDGVEARVQARTDAGGYAIGGEVADYGNYIAAVVEANGQVMFELANE